MTTANEEFADLMPHRIKVTGNSTTPQYDDRGREINTAASREYMCLITDTTTESRTADVVEVSSGLSAYVAPVPIGEQEPVDILDTEKVEILVPYAKTAVVNKIERYFDSEDGVGMLHNIVLRLG